jgi:hypothetical protein
VALCGSSSGAVAPRTVVVRAKGDGNANETDLIETDTCLLALFPGCRRLCLPWTAHA